MDVFFEGWIGPHWLQIRRHDLEGNGTLFVVSDLTDLKDEEEHAARRQMVDAAFEAACQIAADLNHALADSLDDLTRLKEGRGADKAIGRALASSERGAVLGMQLLSLLQGRTLRSVQAELSTLASDTSEMLRVALQDRAELDGLTAKALAATNVDPAMLEYIVLNLIASTRAHLPDTAKIHVHSHGAWLGAEAAETLGVPTGDYVILDVVYPAGAAAPFLQFKLHALGPAAATGDDLGLSLAARFLRQSGGHLAVVTHDDGRAILKILLPRHGEAAERAAAAPETEPALTEAPVPEAPTETVTATEAQTEARAEAPTEAVIRRKAIVVEHDPDVRRMTASLLRQLDYDVMDSGDAEDAIAYSDEAPADLLIAESRLPGAWTGEKLAARLRRKAPNLRVVLMSDTGLGSVEASFGEAAVLLKPFGLDELSALVKRRDTSE